MNKILKYISVIVIIYIVVFSCNKIISNKMEQDMYNSPAIKKISAQMEIQEVAKTMNEKLPRIIDKNTRAMKVEYLENENKLVFYFELNNASIESVEAELPKLKNNQITFIKNNTNNEVYLKAKVIFEYIYIDLDGNELGSYRVSPNEYL